jgi:hypothetical protein
MLPPRRRLESLPHPGKDGSGAPGAATAVPATHGRPGGPGQALPVGLGHHLALPFTAVQAGEMVMHADHAPTFGPPVTRESSSQVTVDGRHSLPKRAVFYKSTTISPAQPAVS